MNLEQIPKLKTFACHVRIGHVGAGRYNDAVIHVKATSAGEAFIKASSLPRIKKSYKCRGVISVKEVADNASINNKENH